MTTEQLNEIAEMFYPTIKNPANDREKMQNFLNSGLRAACIKGLEKMEDVAVAYNKWLSQPFRPFLHDIDGNIFTYWYQNIYPLPTGENKEG